MKVWWHVRLQKQSSYCECSEKVATTKLETKDAKIQAATLKTLIGKELKLSNEKIEDF